MTFCTKVHELPGGREQLEQVTRRLFGKRYLELSDDEADAVWDEIDQETEEIP